MPQISADFRTFTFRLKPGIYFADDPAFKGRKRELVAEDYVYSLKRHYDPRWNSPNLYRLEAAKILGLSELRRQVLKDKKPLPHEQDVEGLRALDRYTFQVRLAEPLAALPPGRDDRRRQFRRWRARWSRPTARDRRSTRWAPGRSARRMAAQFAHRARAQPRLPRVFYDEEAPADDARSLAIAAQLKGRRMPMLDRVEIAIIEESQPRWLSFLNEQTDLMERLPNEFAPVVIPNDKLAPNLAKRGITMDRAPMVDITLAALFNQDNPGGRLHARKVALRRAIALAYDSARRSAGAQGAGRACADRGAPLAFGYNPALKTSMSDHDPARPRCSTSTVMSTATATAGAINPMVRRWCSNTRRNPTRPAASLPSCGEKGMKAVGLKIVFKGRQVAGEPEGLARRQADDVGVAWSATTPDADTFLALAYGPKGGANHARFALKEFDTLYDRQKVLPDGPERERVIEEASKLMVAYVPYKLSCHRIATDLMQPWVLGFRRNPFVREFYKFLDVDPALRAKRRSEPPAPARIRRARRRRSRGALGGAGRGGAAHQGAALLLPDRRDRLRPGARGRHLLADHHRPRLRRPVPLRLSRAAVQVVPNVAVGMPEIADDFRTWTVRIAEGIFFSDDPVFQGRKRELVAQDFVYAFKRFFDPAVRSPIYANVLEEGLLGLEALRNEALREKKPFDYDREVAGVRALDRYTIRFQLAEPRPRFIYTPRRRQLRGRGTRGDRGHGGSGMEHPVGTGPFRLVQWRRGSLMVLERNPNFRRLRYEEAVRRTPATPKARRWWRLSRPAAAHDRPRRGEHRRGRAAALAGLPRRAVRSARRAAGLRAPLVRPTGAWRLTWRAAACACSARPPPTARCSTSTCATR